MSIALDLSHLNPQQREAVLHCEGPMLVIAGAGSGKTRVVTYRILHLLSIGVPASEILAVTFTNKAANEMRHRIEKLGNASVHTSTFHSLGARILRESIDQLGYKQNFVIYDEEDSDKLLRECMQSLNIKEEKGLLKIVRGQISSAKNSMRIPEDFIADDPLLSSLFSAYQIRLKQNNAVDFDDLLYLPVQLFERYPEILEEYQRRWTFFLIDEYQDTNLAQSTLTKLLVAAHRNVFAVGDPDQSIYSWRGAHIDNILSFEKDFPGAHVLSLEQNYRSRNIILQAANGLIDHNYQRMKKSLWSERGEGEKVGLFIGENEHQEMDFVTRKLAKHCDNERIPLSDIVIFYRTHFQSRSIEDALLRHRIPYRIIGGLSFYQRKEIKDILSFLRLIAGGSDSISFTRTINIPKRGLGEASLDKIRDCAQAHHMDVLTCCQKIIAGSMPLKLSLKQQEGIKEYLTHIHSLRELLKEKPPIHMLIAQTIDTIRYWDYLKEDPESFQERKENIAELISKAAEWEQEARVPELWAFLEELTLKSSAEESDQTKDAVNLMTIHNGKGLEYQLVFIVGMEEDLFPHINSKELPETLEEERRLAYVAMTRAKDYLYLTAARYRFLWGTARIMRPSRFISEIPEEYIQSFHATVSTRRNSMDSFDPDEKMFESGDEVFHRDFGVGVIQKAYNTSLGLTYDVFFPQTNNTRSLVAKYAKLISHW